MKNTIEDRDEIIDRIEKKYRKCPKCGKTGISDRDIRCFFCGSRK